MRVFGCSSAGNRTLPSCYSKKFILHDSLPALLLSSWSTVTIKEMTFLIPFPHTFVFLATGWGWILNGEIAGVWPKLLPSPSYTTLSPICSHIRNPASYHFPPVSQVPGTIGSHSRLEPGTVQSGPADRSPRSSPVCNCAGTVGCLARILLISGHLSDQPSCCCFSTFATGLFGL